MPIRLPSNLPAFKTLSKEGVMMMSEDSAERQDIRPLEIALLNLMPEKEKTERQFARLIGSTPLQVKLTLVKITNHKPKNTSPEYLTKFYKAFKDIRNKKFDGFIITGAPIEKLDFSDVNYWEELCQIMDWTLTNVHSVFSICWGAMAMLYHRFGVNKEILKEKASGCFRHANLEPNSPYLRGVSDEIIIPTSRWTKINSSDLLSISDLKILLDSREMGACLIEENSSRTLYMLNHIEYETNSLKEEYLRDLRNDKNTQIPFNYFKNNNPKLKPVNRWRSHAHLLFGNWINQIYQEVPFNLEKIGINKT